MSYANACVCPSCLKVKAEIQAHRSAGRNPFLPNGKLRPPEKPVSVGFPWEGLDEAA